MSAGGAMAQFDGFNPENLNFDDNLLDSVNGGTMPTLPFTPSYPDFDPFNTFEDPFSYPATGPYGQGAGFNPSVQQPQIQPQALSGAHQKRPHPNRPSRTHTHAHPANTHDDASSPQELDDKLLGFGAPTHKAHLIDEATGHVADLSIEAELYGMFFVAEDVFAPPEGNPGNSGAAPTTPNPNQTQQPSGPKPLELTCYRRNLWQCSGSITLPRHVRQMADDQGMQNPVLELAASIAAIESIDRTPTEIISIPWKSSVNGGGNQEENSKSATAPPLISLDLATAEANVNDDGRVSVNLPVAWKRLQFKHATANNGRRKGLQQHYIVQISLLAKVNKGNTDGEWVCIAEISSGAVIVRGRSPRNFDSRRDVPLTGSSIGKMERRSTVGSTPSESGLSRASIAPPEIFVGPGSYQSLGNVQQHTNEWALAQAHNTQSAAQHSNKKLALSPRPGQGHRPPIPAWSTDPVMSTSGSRPSTSAVAPLQKSRANRQTPTLPINLSLSEDEKSSPNQSSDMAASPKFTSKVGAGANAGPNSPVEEVDLLYEYFPLSLDDWSPPVDAIYRPHVVHHTIVPPDLKAQQTRSKAKRYFAAD
ncbi:hypothetical protein MKZ38_007249 [Zalerion maritima]|uniref:NDT80 domain-containing protein n=1 Tax=Zalerion maritima TaxID=339359 RepID=A0AAD5RI11_9PEZI|nr:hypothetical protein MKZ38_007249 [Zalerion maritima]